MTEEEEEEEREGVGGGGVVAQFYVHSSDSLNITDLQESHIVKMRMCVCSSKVCV